MLQQTGRKSHVLFTQPSRCTRYGDCLLGPVMIDHQEGGSSGGFRISNAKSRIYAFPIEMLHHGCPALIGADARDQCRFST